MPNGYQRFSPTPSHAHLVQNLQERLEAVEAEDLSSAVKSTSEPSSISPTRAFRRRGSWASPQSKGKGTSLPPGRVAGRNLELERLREENDRLQEENLQLKEEAVEARLENSTLLNKLEVSTAEASESEAKVCE